MCETLRRELPRAASVGATRRWVAGAIERWVPSAGVTGADVVLAASELVASAVREGSAASLTVVGHRGEIELEVDADPAGPLPVLVGTAAGNAWSLALVAGLSRRWGVEGGSDRPTRRWCEIGLPAGAAPGIACRRP
ncbi:MAG TPA: hypothetical protein VFN60_02575 [Acidimicrobiales bacterium]|nr:hypothetical protein [Acidimicrobiales bacterium]